ncbi:uncharacterized protein LOC122820911 [Gambusia affinis]|uniref:uncharacterized protein LOC122820911 n=1 Tax=Gambusia affinis TaxID=33528 RepID=UPI001CDCEA92|nr:uncharacterized protein LOC122820911 [Gambusia affinis]XP_043954546.1 uncharacterized protein LOC122820911 [Gambusia affinis]
MESEMDNLKLEIKGALFQLTSDQLIEICDFLGMSGTSKDNIAKSRNTLVSLISKYVESDELRQLEDEGMSALLSLLDMIKSVQTVVKNSTAEKENEEEEKLSRELEQLKLIIQQKETEMKMLANKNTKDIRTVVAQASPAHENNPPWRKEFKISGQIGDPGQKDRLTFSSLARQIDNGLSKGYPESEIVEAVIRAIVPGLQLRSYLEGKNDLSLPTLRRILRSHYQERSATELYKQLTTEVQSSRETAQNFVIRAMDLRQKILFASQEADSGLKYDPALVQSMFMHTVLTGLQSDNIKTDLQPHLSKSSTSDELLLEVLNVASANDKERQDKKRNTTQRSTGVHTVQSSDTNNERRHGGHQNVAAFPPDVLSDLKEIKADMVLLKDLKTEVAEIRESIYNKEDKTKLQPAVCRETEYGFPHHRAYATPQLSPWTTEGAAVHHQRGPLQEYQGTYAPRSIRETTQFQQRFAPQRYPVPRPRPRCPACQQQGENFCQHCYRCGSIEHFQAGCRGYQHTPSSAREHPLNEGRLPPRDRE